MKPQWALLQQKFNALNRRERVMVFVASVCLLFFLLHHFFLNPLFVEHKKLKTELAEDGKKLAMYLEQLRQISTTKVIDPDETNRQQLQTLALQQQQIDRELDKMQDTLVRPEQMAQLLADVLRSHQRLKLVTVKTLDVEEIDIKAPPAVAEVAPDKSTEEANKAESNEVAAVELAQVEQKVVIYQHGVEFVVAGGYFELLSAVKKIEALPWNLRWGKFSLNSEVDSDTKLTVTVHTLSVDKEWLSL